MGNQTLLPDFTQHSSTIKEQFQLLFRLFSMFISALSTNEVRAHPWVIEQVLIILHKIQQIKYQLICLEEPLIPQAPLATNDEEPEEQEQKQEIVEIMLNNKEAIEPLIQEINMIVDTLAKVVAQNILIYEHYDCAIHHSLRI